MKKLLVSVAVLGLTAGLAACGGGGGGGGTVVVTPPAGSTDPNEKFGTKFAADFKADANSTPASVSASDVVAVDPTATPSAVH